MRWPVKRRTALSAGALLLAGALAPVALRPLRATATRRAIGDRDSPVRVLLFSRTAGFRHDSIPDAVAAIGALGTAYGFAVDASEDSALFDDTTLAIYRAVVFLLTTGDVLGPVQQAAFERYIRAGHGYVGVHSASDTEYDWPWYGGLVGAYFDTHPAIQTATVRLEQREHPLTAALSDPWVRTDEWYNFRSNPRDQVQVLARLDERTYDGGAMGGDHPIAWYHPYDGGRAWYTAMGHTGDSYVEVAFLQHLLGGIAYAGNLPFRASVADQPGATSPRSAETA
ncbi:MAG: ThuA domain-containing protein [Chloroflexi bacterium]|nr:ThuA domain-containing protein [Chloroflexota bacterium]